LELESTEEKMKFLADLLNSLRQGINKSSGPFEPSDGNLSSTLRQIDHIKEELGLE